MWVKVLPAAETEEVYFAEISDQLDLAWGHLGTFVHGFIEVVKTQMLVSTFGSHPDGWPLVVMVINEQGQNLKLPINKKASKYYPNDYDIMIRGDAVLVGQVQMFDPEDGPYYDITSMPKKWKIIYDMETILAESGNDYEKVHGLFDEFLLEVADPDIAKMYKEARDQMPNWPTA